MLKKPSQKLEVEGDSLDLYHKFTGKKIGFIILLIIVLLIVSIFAMNSGAIILDPTDIVKTLISIGTEITSVVVWRIRLPRILAAIIAGAGLALAGCVMQNNLRNALASPSTLRL